MVRRGEFGRYGQEPDSAVGYIACSMEMRLVMVENVRGYLAVVPYTSTMDSWHLCLEMSFGKNQMPRQKRLPRHILKEISHFLFSSLNY
jgi:hypothetical protein